MLILTPPTSGSIRGSDSYGSGAFAATRGSRRHPGLDFLIEPGEPVYAPINGIVSKVGYPYADDLSFRYIDIDFIFGWCRLMYLEPAVESKDVVSQRQIIGIAQNLRKRYPDGMINHVHLGVRLRWNAALLRGRSGDVRMTHDAAAEPRNWIWVNPGLFMDLGGDDGS